MGRWLIEKFQIAKNALNVIHAKIFINDVALIREQFFLKKKKHKLAPEDY